MQLEHEFLELREKSIRHRAMLRQRLSLDECVHKSRIADGAEYRGDVREARKLSIKAHLTTTQPAAEPAKRNACEIFGAADFEHRALAGVRRIKTRGGE